MRTESGNHNSYYPSISQDRNKRKKYEYQIHSAPACALRPSENNLKRVRRYEKRSYAVGFSFCTNWLIVSVFIGPGSICEPTTVLQFGQRKLTQLNVRPGCTLPWMWASTTSSVTNCSHLGHLPRAILLPCMYVWIFGEQKKEPESIQVPLGFKYNSWGPKSA